MARIKTQNPSFAGSFVAPSEEKNEWNEHNSKTAPWPARPVQIKPNPTKSGKIKQRSHGLNLQSQKLPVILTAIR